MLIIPYIGMKKYHIVPIKKYMIEEDFHGIVDSNGYSSYTVLEMDVTLYPVETQSRLLLNGTRYYLMEK